MVVGQRPGAVAFDGQPFERFAAGIGVPGYVVGQLDSNLHGFRIAGFLRVIRDVISCYRTNVALIQSGVFRAGSGFWRARAAREVCPTTQIWPGGTFGSRSLMFSGKTRFSSRQLWRKVRFTSSGEASATRRAASMTQGARRDCERTSLGGTGSNAIKPQIMMAQNSKPRTTPNAPPNARSSQTRSVDRMKRASIPVTTAPRMVMPQNTIRKPKRSATRVCEMWGRKLTATAR